MYPARSWLLFDAVAASEPLDTASGVDDALLAREVRVARAANLNVNVSLRSSRLERAAARAVHQRFDVFRVDTLFHVPCSFPSV
jgi:hypothetical protein